MKQKLLNKNLLILFTFVLIGLVAHFKSFQLVPYGDDWKFIYNYYTHEEKDLNFSNFPGIFSYLAPYGPAILAIGVVFQFFGQKYFIYYLVPLIFKILTAFILFLTLQTISQTFKKNSFVNYLLATLFLVGFTGIQAIDWAMNMNVYIALFIFSVGLFFQCKYFIDQKSPNLILSFIFLMVSMIAAPTRLTPLVLILPLVDLTMLFKNSRLFKPLFLKNTLFVILIYIFFFIGIFGNPGQINNSGLINPFVDAFLNDPILAFGIFMHWIGVTILPVYPPSSDIFKTASMGILFVSLLISAFYRSRSRWLIIGSLIYFIPLFLMWLSSSLFRITDADSRHLLVPFFGLCFLSGLIYMSLGRTKNVLRFLLLILVLYHIYSVDKIYTHWISIGRGADFITPVQEKIVGYFPIPISEPKIIFLDFDDAAIQQSIEFGIGYRIAFLSGTRNINFLPTPISKRDVLIKEVEKQISMGREKDKLIDNIYAFQLRKKVFTDITLLFREELKKEII